MTQAEETASARAADRDGDGHVTKQQEARGAGGRQAQPYSPVKPSSLGAASEDWGSGQAEPGVTSWPPCLLREEQQHAQIIKANHTPLR